MISSNSYPSNPFFGAYAKIYTLSDTSGNVFYVGNTTKDFKTRVNAHITDAKYNKMPGNIDRNEKIRSLNYVILAQIVHIEWVTSNMKKDLLLKGNFFERLWIQKHLEQGDKLTNRRFSVVMPHQRDMVGLKFITERTSDFNRTT